MQWLYRHTLFGILRSCPQLLSEDYLWYRTGVSGQDGQVSQNIGKKLPLLLRNNDDNNNNNNNNNNIY